MNDCTVLLLREIQGHTESIWDDLSSKFEKPSIKVIHSEEQFDRLLRVKPIFDPMFLILFENVRLVKKCLPKFDGSGMFIVIKVPSNSQVEEVKGYLSASGINYKFCDNPYTKAMAIDYLFCLSGQKLSDNFCSNLLSKTGLNPERIRSAVEVCEQLGFKKSVVDKYVDRWMFEDTRGIVSVIVGKKVSGAQSRRIAQYLYNNRHWFRYIRTRVVKEFDLLVQVYRAKLSGLLSSDDVLDFEVSHSEVLFAIDLFTSINLGRLMAGREFAKSMTLADLSIKLCEV